MTKKTITTELEELFDLYQSEAVTKEEYESLKAKLIAKNAGVPENQAPSKHQDSELDVNTINSDNNEMILEKEDSVNEINPLNLKAKKTVANKKTTFIFIAIGVICGLISIFYYLYYEKQTEIKTNYIIKQGSVGDIFIGGKIEQIPKEYKITKKVELLSTEGEDYEQIIYEITKENDLVCKAEQDGKNETINEISVSSEKYKTQKNIGVGSTIKEFMSAYPSSAIMYYGESSTPYVAMAKEFETIQFEIDSEGYIGTEDGGPEEILKFSDFKPNSKIISIRLWALYEPPH